MHPGEVLVLLLQLSDVSDTANAKRIMRQISEDTPWMAVENSWRVGKKEQVRSHAPLAAATGISTEGKWKLR